MVTFLQRTFTSLVHAGRTQAMLRNSMCCLYFFVTFIIWKIKIKYILAVCSLMIGCSSNYSIEPNEIILTYGESSISALIQESNVFEGINDTNKETVEFSGTITKQDTGYLVDIVVVREAKDRKTSQHLNTAVMLKNEESVVIGGINNYSFSIILKK
jgi:hypothetical protein